MISLTTLSKFYNDKATVISALERWSAQLNRVIDLYETAPVIRPPLRLVYRPKRFRFMSETGDSFNQLEFLLETYADLLNDIEHQLKGLESYNPWDWVDVHESNVEVESDPTDYEAYEHMYTRNMRA